jgi:hypothetical protein
VWGAFDGEEKAFTSLTISTSWMEKDLKAYPHINVNQMPARFTYHDNIKTSQVL